MGREDIRKGDEEGGGRRSGREMREITKVKKGKKENDKKEKGNVGRKENRVRTKIKVRRN